MARYPTSKQLVKRYEKACRKGGRDTGLRGKSKRKIRERLDLDPKID